MKCPKKKIHLAPNIVENAPEITKKLVPKPDYLEVRLEDWDNAVAAIVEKKCNNPRFREVPPTCPSPKVVEDPFKFSRRTSKGLRGFYDILFQADPPGQARTFCSSIKRSIG